MPRSSCALLLLATAAPLLAIAAAARPTASASVSALQWAPPPPWCDNIACPPYEVLAATGEYETRRYAPSAWVVTSVLSDSYSAATREGFRRLFSYLQGANAAGSQIAMTAPVAVRVAPNGNYTVAFYAAPPAGADSSEADPPEPTAPDVALVRMPEVTAYALSYGGWATDATVRAKAGQLLEALASDGEPFSTRAYISAEYDAPFKLLWRHNEVLVFKHDVAALPFAPGAVVTAQQ